jgi:broad-specificity NMP kinase
MNIVLKTDVKALQCELKCYRDAKEKVPAQLETEFAAHAMQMAIEEIGKESDVSNYFSRDVERRAAANLARMMGEGNG